MSLFKDKIDLKMMDSKRHIVEKYDFDVRKDVIIDVATGYEAFVNGMRISAGQSQEFSKKSLGPKITAYVYQKSRVARPISVPFFAGQHTISLDSNKMAKVTFAVVGDALIEINDFPSLIKYFDNTVAYEDVEKELMDKFQKPLSTQMAAAAKTYINSASTDVSIYANLKDIAKAGLSNATLKQMAMDMGLFIMSSGINLRLNPVGESADIIARINDKFNERALESVEEEKEREKRQWEREDKLIDNQHEIDIINAEHTDTKSTNNNNTYTYNGNVPQNPHGQQQAPKESKKRFCPNCGKQAADKDTFCSACGTRLK